MNAATLPAPLAFRVDWRAQLPNAWGEHWGARQRRHATAHRAFRDAVERLCLVPPALPVVVTLSRVSHGRADVDGVVSSLKPVIDACAEWLGCDDRDPRIDWRFDQTFTREKVRLRTWDGHGNPTGWRNAYAVWVNVEIGGRTA